jgi:hypothetical protein
MYLQANNPDKKEAKNAMINPFVCVELIAISE